MGINGSCVNRCVLRCRSSNFLVFDINYIFKGELVLSFKALVLVFSFFSYLLADPLRENETEKKKKSET